MNTKEFDEVLKAIYDEQNKVNKLKSDLVEIKKFSLMCNEQNNKLCNDFQSTLKFFYPNQVKAHLGKFNLSDPNSKSSYIREREIQMSKRGVGYNYWGGGNMDLFRSFFGSEYSLETVFKNKELFNEVKKHLNDNGKKYFDDIKTLIEKSELEYTEKTYEFEVQTSAIGEAINQGKISKIKVSAMNGTIELKTDNENGRTYYNNGTELFTLKHDNNIKFADNLDSKILSVVYRDEINENIKLISADAKRKNEKWETFIEHFNKLSAKYILMYKL